MALTHQRLIKIINKLGDNVHTVGTSSVCLFHLPTFSTVVDLKLSTKENHIELAPLLLKLLSLSPTHPRHSRPGCIVTVIYYLAIYIDQSTIPNPTASLN
jgi:hypothetical protein